MAKRLFSCSSNDIEEIDYFSKIMEDNNIDCYDVPGSSFGLSKPSLWIRNDDDYPKAKALFIEHESAYAELARERYQRETGYNPEASDKEKWRFFLKNLREKRGTLPFIFLGFVIVYWYFDSIFGLFSPK
ncbi:MAG: DUF6164 family protein [Gammaproteobacteria bacterium]|nr:DUF6164 family protein [Gammaproteobacteria bacterium]